MHVITVTGQEPGDYLHPDQQVEIVDETTGTTYHCYLRSNEKAPTEGGEVSLFIPVAAIKSIQADDAYCVLTLSPATTAREVKERKERLTRPPVAAAKRMAR